MLNERVTRALDCEIGCSLLHWTGPCIYSVLPFYAYLVIEGNKTIVIDEQDLSAFRALPRLARTLPGDGVTFIMRYREQLVRARKRFSNYSAAKTYLFIIRSANTGFYDR